MTLLYLPPELAGDPAIKNFVAWLSNAICQYGWPPRCPACGADKLWRDGTGARITLAPVQRYRCPACGTKCCERTNTPFAGKHAPAAQVWTSQWLFVLGLAFRAIARETGSSHQTVSQWCLELELENAPLACPGAVWIGDETFVRVAGRQMYELKIIDWQGRTLARVLSPRRRAQEVQYLLQEVTQRYPTTPPQLFMHDANPIYHRALQDRGLCWPEGVVTHCREFVAADGATTNPLEGHWSHFHVWRASHRGFKKWAHAQHYHEQYSRAKNQPKKTLLEMMGITRN